MMRTTSDLIQGSKETDKSSNMLPLAACRADSGAILEMHAYFRMDTGVLIHTIDTEEFDQGCGTLPFVRVRGSDVADDPIPVKRSGSGVPAM